MTVFIDILKKLVHKILNYILIESDLSIRIIFAFQARSRTDTLISIPMILNMTKWIELINLILKLLILSIQLIILINLLEERV
jgi:hypothetical protein